MFNTCEKAALVGEPVAAFSENTISTSNFNTIDETVNYLNVNFPIGFGKYDTDKIKGTKIYQHNLQHISYEKIKNLAANPQIIQKDESSWFMPHDQLTREKSHLDEHAKYYMLTLDVDETSLPFEVVIEAIKCVIGFNTSYIAYTSRSATKETQKMRLLAPIIKPLDARLWTALQTVFFNELAKYQVKADYKLNEPTRLVYLPNKGDFYTYDIQDGELFNPAIWEEKVEKQLIKNVESKPPKNIQKPTFSNQTSALGKYVIEKTITTAQSIPNTGGNNRNSRFGGFSLNLGRLWGGGHISEHDLDNTIQYVGEILEQSSYYINHALKNAKYEGTSNPDYGKNNIFNQNSPLPVGAIPLDQQPPATQQAASMSPDENSDNTPLDESPRYIDEDLINICRDSPIAIMAEELAKAAQMPRNSTFLSALSIFSAVSSRVYKVNYQDGSSQPTSLFVCVEQPPATSKSRVIRSPQSPIFNKISEQRKDIKRQLDEASELLELSEDKDEKKELKKKIIDLKKQRDQMFEFITDSTPEALDMTLQNSSGFYSIASAEQGAINSLLGMSYKDEKSQANRDLVLKGYNGEFHNSKRKGRETYMGEVVGSITAFAQEGMINNLLNASGNTGVIERFILWSEPHLLGQRDHLTFYKMNDLAIYKYDSSILAIYTQIKGFEYQELKELSLSVRSWDEIRKLRQEYESTIGNGGENSASLLRGAIGKIDILIMKIAANLHLSIESHSTLIHDDRVREAILIAKVYIKHLKNLIIESEINLLTEAEETLLKFMKMDTKTGREIADKLRKRKCFLVNGVACRESVAQAVQSLIKKDKLMIVTESPKFNDTTYRYKI